MNRATSRDPQGLRGDAARTPPAQHVPPERPSRASEERVSPGIADAVLASVLDGVLVIDSRGTIELANPAAERIFGHPAHQLVGRNVSMLMPPPYRDEHDGYLERYRETGDRRIIGIGREVTGLRKDGSTFPLDLSVAEVRVAGETLFVGTVRDLTARERAAADLRRETELSDSLIDTAEIIVLVVDRQGKIVRTNRHLEELTGYRRNELAGADWFDLFIPERERERLRGRHAEALKGRRHRTQVSPIVTRKGEERLIDWTSSLLHDGEGELTGLLAIGRDITEKVELERQLLQSQKMEALGRLAGGVAHDFNTMLGSIRGYSELLLDELDGGEHRRYVEQIHKAGKRGASLTEQLLAFSRRQPTAKRTFDLAAVVTELLPMIERLIGEDVVIECRVDPAPAPVEASPSQLEQVILNLVVNAREAMPEGGTLAIELSSRGGPDGGDGGPRSVGEVDLTVRDTGMGMTDEVRSRIFEPFFTTKEGSGTGLGLSTVYGIVTACNGTIQVDSRPGEGAAFRVRLPRQSATDVVSEEEMVQPEEAPGHGSETVLLVEDDEMFRELIEIALASRGYRVLAAGSPAEARDSARGESIDLLISDVVMPGGTGYQLADELARTHPGAKVILMSGHADDILARGDAAPVAADGFLHKPFGMQELARLVRRILDDEESRRSGEQDPARPRRPDPTSESASRSLRQP